ncbi:MAG TPA: ketopantoate reductase family protein [Candidatus Brocadiia bacterium]|nr:ketopantoate reductase family protein [Candidatus Brocadiia bacterium]
MSELRPSRRFVILGAGAVGSGFGVMLGAAGHEVRMIGRAAHMDAISRNGLRIDGLWGEHFTRNVRAETVLPMDAAPDYTLITCKAYDTESVVAGLPPDWPGQVVVLQNGFGNQQIAADRFGPARTMAGMVIIGFAIPEPGRVTVTVSADSVKLGRLGGGRDAAVEELAALFRAVGIPCDAADDVSKYLWAKVLYNSSLNPLGAMLDTHYGALLQPDSWRIIERVVHEAFDAFAPAGVTTFWNSAEGYLEYLRGYQVPATFDHRPSMLVDIRKGRPTEIDFINGAIARLGERHAIPTPVNWTLVRMIKALESKAAGGGKPQTRWQ